MFETEFAEDEEEHLEVVFLLVADGVNLPVEVRDILEAKQRRADVLGHVDRRAILSEQELLVEAVPG